MSRQLTALHRASFTLGALFITWGVAPHAVAADPVQRVAMACTQDAGCKSTAVARHAATHSVRTAPEVAPVKAPKVLPSASKGTVDYEHDLWRHQSAS